MENIQAQATNQLLNIQDDLQDIIFQPYKVLQTSQKNIKDRKFNTKVIQQKISIHTFPMINKNDNKANLKTALQKLLQGTDQSPKNGLTKSIFVRNTKSMKILSTMISNVSNLSPNAQNTKTIEHQLINLNKNPSIVSQAKQQRFTYFIEESQQIRKLIKKRLNEKKIQKDQLIKESNIQKTYRIKSIIKDQNKFVLKNQNQLKQRNKLFVNLSAKSRRSSKKPYEKQNVCTQPISNYAKIISIDRNQAIYDSRNLRNILF